MYGTARLCCMRRCGKIYLLLICPCLGYNYISACFNSPSRINNPAHNCSFEIRAAAYDWKNPLVQEWFLDAVIKPVLSDGFDGIWLDGNGPDNGAYMCSG